MSHISDVPLNLSNSNEIIDLTGDSPVVNSARTRHPRNLLQIHRISFTIDRNSRIRDDSSSPLYYDPLTSVERDDSFIQIIDPDEAQSRVRQVRDPAEFDEINNVDANEEYSTTVPCINDSCNGEQVVLSCPICLEPLAAERRPMATRCGHIFCAQCLKNALERSKVCSKCNAPVKIKSCIRLYF